MKKIVILGDGHIWDIRGIDPEHPAKIFEDLFSGRALGERAEIFARLFEKFKEKDKSRLTGLSVTRALLSKKDKLASQKAGQVIKEMGEAAGRGIEILTQGRANKPGWSSKEAGFWKGLTAVVIGAGVSQGRTGSILIKAIRHYLKKRNLGHIEILKARFPGKEAGFLGGIANIIDLVSREKEIRRFSRVGIIGLDLGRTGVGVGVTVINPGKRAISLKKPQPWIFRYSRKTQGANKIKNYLHHKKVGIKLRSKIINQLAELICLARKNLEDKNIPYARHIAVAVPGRVSRDGYILDSADYLPFFRKKDSFHFSGILKKRLREKGCSGFRIQVLNDGIAAGLANLRLGVGLANLKVGGKYAFLGPGSGLGGCVCEIKEMKR